MTDLSTSHMGIKLRNPVIAGASGLTSDLDTIKRIEDAGAGAVVCKSLFEEEIKLEAMAQQKALHQYDDLNAEMITVFPDIKEKGPEYHLYWLRKTREALSIPVIASLNAVNREVWLEYAGLIEQTGVDGLELNLYSYPDALEKSSAEIEDEQLALLKDLAESVSLPLSVKIGPYYTNIANFIKRADEAGIKGWVLFNRYFNPDMTLDRMEQIFPFNFSSREEIRLPMRYAGILHGNISGSVCASSGIDRPEDVLKLLLAGASAVQVVSTLYRNGIKHIGELTAGVERWMNDNGYSSVDEFRGSMSNGGPGAGNLWYHNRTQYVGMLMQTGVELADQIV